MPNVANLMARWKNRALAVARQHPELFFPLLRLRSALPPARQYPFVGSNTDFILEGYWRSANTFASQAFQSVQPRTLNIACHTHAAATVVRGVQLNKPVLVLIREPDAALISRRLLHPAIPFSDSIREYVAFHRRIIAWRDGFVAAGFEEVIHDFGAVIRRVNARFNTEFVEYRHTPELSSRLRWQSDQFLPSVFQLPADERNAINRALRAELLEEPGLEAARHAYREFLRLCNLNSRPVTVSSGRRAA